MFFRRRDNGTDSQAEILREELNSVSEAARSGDCDAARRALHLRHQLGLLEVEKPATDIGYVEPEDARIGPDRLPEVAARDLTAPLLRGAILDRGCLLVRGLVREQEAVHIRGRIDRALGALAAIEAGDPPECGFFEHFAPDPRYGLHERTWVTGAGGLWTADSPFLTADVCALFEQHFLAELARDYLREEPLLSVQKGTLRKISPGTGGAWHQDGHFLGSVKALNVWISLSRCGDVSPGMDLVPRRLEEIVATGTEGAPLDWTVAEDMAREVAGDRGIVRPIFNPGDALMFDEMFLHTTAAEETMSESRYAIETWFFGSSAFPPEYAPIAL
jgi:hypothetical protein